MARVFITQENMRLDYTPAEAFGEITFITRFEWSPIKGSLDNVALLREVRRRLAKYDPDVDFIIVSGSPTVAALVFMYLGSVLPKPVVQILRWSNRDMNYQPVHLDLSLVEEVV